MFIFLFSFFCLLLASSIVTSKQIILFESNDTKATLQTESPSFLTIQNHQYKRQLLSSIQVLDLGKYALLKHNLLSQISRYQNLKVFHVHNQFFSREDLHFQYYFAPEKISYPECHQLCLSKDAAIINTKQQLLDIEQYIPRSKEYYWIRTRQEAWSVSKYRARYRIYFDNINLDSYPNALDTKKPKYYFLDHNYTLTEFPRSQLGPVLRYYDNLKDNYWVKSFPELQIQVNLTRDINIIYPPPSQSLKHTQLASNCICAKDLRENHFELKNSQRIVHDAQQILLQLPLHLEQKRIQNDHVSSNISVTDILKSNLSQKHSILSPDRLKQIFLQDSDANQEQNYDFSYLKSMIKYLSFFEPIPENITKIEKQSNRPFNFKIGENIEVQKRHKRLPLKFLKKFPTKIFSKILKIGGTYLLQNFKPFLEFQDVFTQYFDILKYSSNHFVPKNFSLPQTVKINPNSHIFNLTLNDRFQILNSLSNPGLFHANEIFRASNLLQHTYQNLLKNIPYQIFNHIRAELPPIYHAKARISQHGSLFFVHFVIECQVEKKKIERFHFRSLPHAKIDDSLVQYEVPESFSPELERYNLKFDLCVRSLVHKDSFISYHCPLKTLQQLDFISELYSIADRSFLLVKGPNHLQAKCANHPSVFAKIASDFAVISLGGGCVLETTYQNIRGQFKSPPQLASHPYFEIVHQYNVTTMLSQENITKYVLLFFAFIIFSTCLLFVLFSVKVRQFVDNMFDSVDTTSNNDICQNVDRPEVKLSQGEEETQSGLANQN